MDKNSALLRQIQAELDSNLITLEEIQQEFSEIAMDYCTTPYFHNNLNREKKAATIRSIYHILSYLKKSEEQENTTS